MINEDKLQDLYYTYVDMVYKICYIYFKGNKADIEDAIQSIFLKVIEKNVVFKNEEHTKAWFIITTHNYCKNKVKHWWNKNKELDFDIEETQKTDDTLPYILNLPDKYKTPIYLYYYEGYTCPEIASILHTKENTVYSLLNRGRQILKEKLRSDF